MEDKVFFVIEVVHDFKWTFHRTLSRSGDIFRVTDDLNVFILYEGKDEEEARAVFEARRQ